MKHNAVLALADGSVFTGVSVGVEGERLGELVFNTAMTGYQEILTDPSYAEQIVTFTYPHIGSTGVNPEDAEAAHIWAKGLVFRDLPRLHSNWRATQSLSEYLVEKNLVGIAGIDTRALTHILRVKGSQNACLLAASDPFDKNSTHLIESAIKKAREFSGIEGLDLAKVVSTKQPYQWNEPAWRLKASEEVTSKAVPAKKFKVIALDFGVKRNILRLLVDAGCEVTVLPAESDIKAILAYRPDGVFLSNGPGDPEPCGYAINTIKALVAEKIPLFGICLGHQLLALASGAKTRKMDVGHHGANHPVQCLNSQGVMITSQNHGFAVTADSISGEIRLTHRSLFDETVQGIERLDCPAFGFQGHPEASPGPRDAEMLFQHFCQLMSEAR